MKIVVIGGCGHIGSFLVPKLVKNNNEVIAISRGNHQPYVEDKSWSQVKHVHLDREKDAEFERKVADFEADVVVDLISFYLDDTKKWWKH